MNREDLYSAIGDIDEKMLEEAAQNKRLRPRVPKAAVVAAALAVCVGGTAAVSAVTGHFSDIKNIFGTVTGTEYLDATDDLDIEFMGFKGGQLNVGFDIKQPDKAPYMTLGNGAELKLLSYNVTDDDGNVILDSGDSVVVRLDSGGVTEYSYTEGEVMPYAEEPYVWSESDDNVINGEFSDSAVTYSVIIGSESVTVGTVGLTFDEQLAEYGLKKENLEECGDLSTYSFTYTSSSDTGDCVEILYESCYKDVTTGKLYLFPTGTKPLDKGVYTLNVDKLVMTSKGDQPLEITGDWHTDFEIGDDPAGLFV